MIFPKPSADQTKKYIFQVSECKPFLTFYIICCTENYVELEFTLKTSSLVEEERP